MTVFSKKMMVFGPKGGRVFLKRDRLLVWDVKDELIFYVLLSGEGGEGLKWGFLSKKQRNVEKK